MIAESGGLKKQIFALTCTIEEQKKEIAALKKHDIAEPAVNMMGNIPWV